MRKLIALFALLVLLASICPSGLGAAAEEIDDGLYIIAVDSDSQMFKVVQCLLRVTDGQMTAAITLNGQGYGYLYPGTAAQADAAPREDWAPYVEGLDGKYCYEIPIAAMDAQVPVAAWSKKYEKWYDRTLNFHWDTLRAYQWVPEDGRYTAQAQVDGDWIVCTLDVVEGVMSVRLDQMEGTAFALSSLDLPVRTTFSTEDAQTHVVFVDSKSLCPARFVPEDGQYVLSCEADSALFQVESCQLEVQNGKIQVVLLVKKDTYDKIWIGPSAKARLADPKEYIEARPNEEGGCAYNFSLDALEEEWVISTWSEQQKAWYERTLHFDLDGLSSY